MATLKNCLSTIIIILSLFAGTTALSGQITLQDNEFKFYAGKLIDSQCLQEEVLLMQQQLNKNSKYCDSLESKHKQQVSSLEFALGKDTTIRNNYKTTANEYQEKNYKLSQKIKNLRLGLFGSFVFLAAETVIIYNVIIKK